MGTPVCSRAIEIGVAAVCARAPPKVKPAAWEVVTGRNGAWGARATVPGGTRAPAFSAAFTAAFTAALTAAALAAVTAAVAAAAAVAASAWRCCNART